MKFYLIIYYRLFFFLLFLPSFTLLSSAETNDLIGTCTDKSMEYTNKALANSKKSQCVRISLNDPPQTEALSVCNECDRSYVSTASRPFMPLSTWIAEQEYNFLRSCESNAHRRRAERREQQLDIPEVCFHVGMLRTSDAISNFYDCKNKAQIKPEEVDSNYRPCLNSDYVKMTARAFNDVADCFGFSKKEKKEVFATFNHESAFILNARSDDGARCYGQMTFLRFQDLNRYIYFSRKPVTSWNAYHNVYSAAVERCPYLRNTVVPREMLNDSTIDFPGLDKHNKNPPFTCSLIMDPYPCLFYSMYNIKVHQAEFEHEYLEPASDLENINVSPRIVQDFRLPIKYNEMLVVQGTVTAKNGEQKEINWTFRSDAELYHTIVTKGYSYNTSELHIQKVSLFDPKELKTHFVHTAHNGGSKVITSHFHGFMEFLKRKISNGKQCNKNADCKRYREQVFNVASRDDKESELPPILNREDLNKEFRYRYAYGKIRGQTRKFMSERGKHMDDHVMGKKLPVAGKPDEVSCANTHFAQW